MNIPVELQVGWLGFLIVAGQECGLALGVEKDEKEVRFSNGLVFRFADAREISKRLN